MHKCVCACVHECVCALIQIEFFKVTVLVLQLRQPVPRSKNGDGAKKMDSQEVVFSKKKIKKLSEKKKND